MQASVAQTPVAWAWPGTVYGVALNDAASLAALGTAVHQPPYKAPPQAPVLYIKPRNTWAAPGAAVVVPAGIPALHMGPALGVVMGRTACRLSPADALAAVAGYGVANDITVPTDTWYRPGLRLRARDGFCPMAAQWVPAAQVPHPDALALRVWLDGRLAFEANTRSFVRTLAQLLVDITAFMTLQPGDMLLTGVPHGAPLARPGQAVTIDIPGVGQLQHRLVAEEPLA